MGWLFCFTFSAVNNICLNGKIIPRDQPIWMADNRSYRYGDGLFETMKMINGRIILSTLHFERLFNSLKLLGYTIPKLFNIDRLEDDIIKLCRKNDCERLARIRLSISRGNGGLYDGDQTLHYLIETWPLTESANRLNENGIVLGVFHDTRKSTDVYAQLKSANFLGYIMAANYAQDNKWNDCLVLNANETVADSTIANLFIVKNRLIHTPGDNQGCIHGVMRRFLLSQLSIEQRAITIEDVTTADEVFLSNAINGIRWVKQFGETKYTNTLTTQIYLQHIQPIFQ